MSRGPADVPPPPAEPPTVHLDKTAAEMPDRQSEAGTADPEQGRGARARDWWEGLREAGRDGWTKGSATRADEAAADDASDSADDAPDGWWGEIFDADGEQRPDAETDAAPRAWLVPQPGYYPRPAWVDTATEGRTRPALSEGTRRLLSNAGAAGAGWLLGLEPAMGDAIAECGRETSISGALVLGGGMCLLIAHVWDRRTRHWWWLLALLARIPLASAITALALYAPGSQL
ncbi:hypothetical protein B7755_052160 [Streptomyces sp. NBS 14/10]|uniref:hypothetical protein n=1 Tax=Streptomyces sp. NBS 14/10 TaxID=1945643 RepID=UPI001180C0B5|nr:hypothetical protein [Streptomyces sp. NBS 14/10]KAK1176704.1 hypothetical protein B7755_052160 [Streptomyces sp. NBS 14/10]